MASLDTACQALRARLARGPAGYSELKGIVATLLDRPVGSDAVRDLLQDARDALVQRGEVELVVFRSERVKTTLHRLRTHARAPSPVYREGP